MATVKAFLNKHFHAGHNALHLTYLGLVAVEGHGFYSFAAGGLFGLIVVGFFLGEEVEE